MADSPRTTLLGKVYRDTVTGFTGMATARTEYLLDTPNVRLEAKTGQEDKKERWVGEARLEIAPVDPAAGFSK